VGEVDGQQKKDVVVEQGLWIRAARFPMSREGSLKGVIGKKGEACLFMKNLLQCKRKNFKLSHRGVASRGKMINNIEQKGGRASARQTTISNGKEKESKPKTWKGRKLRLGSSNGVSSCQSWGTETEGEGGLPH